MCRINLAANFSSTQCCPLNRRGDWSVFVGQPGQHQLAFFAWGKGGMADDRAANYLSDTSCGSCMPLACFLAALYHFLPGNTLVRAASLDRFCFLFFSGKRTPSQTNGGGGGADGWTTEKRVPLFKSFYWRTQCFWG